MSDYVGIGVGGPYDGCRLASCADRFKYAINWYNAGEYVWKADTWNWEAAPKPVALELTREEWILVYEGFTPICDKETAILNKIEAYLEATDVAPD